MSFEKAVSVRPIEGSNGHRDICVLVVDCDPTCLMTISGMLRSLTYQVVTVERAADALAMTLEREDEVDLVMTELHMPDMDGLQLLDEIQKTSKLPVVITSADADEDVMLRSLNKGAVYYAMKPVNIHNIKNLWQYVFLNRREKQLQKTGQKGGVEVESLGENESDVDADSALISNGKHGYQEPPTDTVETGKDEEEDTLTSPVRKKAKLCWTSELHNKFLFAIGELGLDNAHPKKILRLMGVEGLTKEHISSHLQKYRLSVKRDRKAVQSVLEFATKKTTMDYFGSGFALYHPQIVYGIQAPKLQQTTMASQPGFTAYIQSNRATPSNIKHGQYSNQLFNQQNFSYPSINSAGSKTATSLHELDQTAMAFNAGRASNDGWGLFTNSIMQPPQLWLPPPPPQGQGTDKTFNGEAEADAMFYMRKGSNQLFPKQGFDHPSQ